MTDRDTAQILSIEVDAVGRYTVHGTIPLWAAPDILRQVADVMEAQDHG